MDHTGIPLLTMTNTSNEVDPAIASFR